MRLIDYERYKPFLTTGHPFEQEKLEEKDKMKIKPWEYVKTTKTINDAELNEIISDN